MSEAARVLREVKSYVDGEVERARSLPPREILEYADRAGQLLGALVVVAQKIARAESTCLECGTTEVLACGDYCSAKCEKRAHNRSEFRHDFHAEAFGGDE